MTSSGPALPCPAPSSRSDPDSNFAAFADVSPLTAELIRRDRICEYCCFAFCSFAFAHSLNDFFFLLLFCFCLMASIHSGFRFHPVRSSVWFNFIFTLHFVLRLFLPLHLFRIVHSPFSFVLLKTCFFFVALFVCLYCCAFTL